MQERYADKLHIKFIVYITFIIVVGAVIKHGVDTDYYFLINTGKYIVENKLVPTDNIWVIHENYKLIIQQWLLDIMQYGMYSLFGMNGTTILTAIFLVLYNITLYLYSKIILKNKYTIIITMCILNILIFQFFSSRPYLITASIINLEMCILNKYFNNKINDIKYIIEMCLISLFQINFQCASWVILFVMILPYIVPEIWVKKWYKNIDWHKILISIFVIIAMICVAFINPNGVDSLLYLYKSRSIVKSAQISELLPSSFISIQGFTLILTLVLFVRKADKLKYSKGLIYLTIGTFILATMQIRNQIYLNICLVSWIGLSIESIVIKLHKTSSNKVYKLIKTSYIIVGFLATILVTNELITYDYSNSLEQQDAVEYLNSLDKDNIVLYTDFATGNYFEFEGYKVYMDARPELYMKEINGQYDLYEEYKDIASGKIDFDEFTSKYEFTHLDVPIYSSFDTYLYYNVNYKLISENDSYRLYEKIN
jgi:hypothetical protein